MCEENKQLENIIDVEAVEEPEDLEKLEEVEVWFPGKPEPISFLHCTSCYLNRQCPLYDETAESCPLNALEPVDTSTGKGIIELVQTMLAMQAKRVLRMVRFEEAEGGVADPNVTREMQTFVDLVERLKRILSDDDMLVIRAKGKAANGVISKLLKDLNE